MKPTIKQLLEEVAHWKRVASENRTECRNAILDRDRWMEIAKERAQDKDILHRLIRKIP